MADYTREILDTVETFLETCPGIPDELDIEFDPRDVDQGGTVSQVVTIGGDRHLITCKRLDD